MIERLSIVGLGLIGGSLARALRRARACGEIIGCMRSEDNLRKAHELGIIDEYETDPGRAVVGADMVVLGVPLGANRAVMEQIVAHLAPDATLTDVGSAKTGVIADARATLGPRLTRFVPAHPIAGTEQSGVLASFAELFQGRRVVVTPIDETLDEATDKVRTMWESTGATVESMTPRDHDRILAATSHVPHVLSYALVDCLAAMDAKADIFRYAAGGFADFTRIASSSPEMWADIVFANRAEVLAALDTYTSALIELTGALAADDRPRVVATFATAKRERDAFAGTWSKRGPANKE